MKAFNKWYDNIEKEYPLYQDKDGYNIGNTPALKVGWKAALEWVLREGIDDWVEDTIKEELKE